MSLLWNSRRLLVLVATLALVSLLAFSVACGDDDDDAGGDDDGAATTAPADGGDDGGVETIEVSLQDFNFAPSAITAAAGASVTFNITNEGAAPHNMRIAGPDGEYETDDDAVSDSDTIRADETATLDWTAPDEAGEILFRCDFHPTQMSGTIAVE